MKDCDNNELKVGDEFLYQFGTKYQTKGKIIIADGVEAIRWDEDGEITVVSDFYYELSDQYLLKKIKPEDSEKAIDNGTCRQWHKIFKPELIDGDHGWTAVMKGKIGHISISGHGRTPAAAIRAYDMAFENKKGEYSLID